MSCRSARRRDSKIRYCSRRGAARPADRSVLALNHDAPRERRVHRSRRRRVGGPPAVSARRGPFCHQRCWRHRLRRRRRLPDRSSGRPNRPDAGIAHAAGDAGSGCGSRRRAHARMDRRRHLHPPCGFVELARASVCGCAPSARDPAAATARGAHNLSDRRQHFRRLRRVRLPRSAAVSTGVRVAGRVRHWSSDTARRFNCTIWRPPDGQRPTLSGTPSA